MFSLNINIKILSSHVNIEILSSQFVFSLLNLNVLMRGETMHRTQFLNILIFRSQELMSPIHRPAENLFDKELLETHSNDMEEDFIPGSLAHSPDFPILGTSPFFGCMSG